MRGDGRPALLQRVQPVVGRGDPALTSCPRSARPATLTPAGVGAALQPFKGHRMAKGALEMAFLDAELRAAAMSFGTYLGATRDRVPVRASRSASWPTSRRC